MAATRIDPGQATGQNFADRHALGSWLRASASLRAGAAPAATPTAAEASSSTMLLGSKHNAQALKSWLSQTKDLRSERATADVEAQRGAGLEQLHVLSKAKRARSHAARMQQLTNSGVPALQPPPGTITVPMPPGFTIRTGKKISGVLDVAAPLDPATLEDELARHMGADSVTFLSQEGLRQVAGEEICAACFDGNYVVPVSQNERAEITQDRRG